MVPRYTFFEVIYMINYEHLAKKLKSFRTQRKLSQTTLAELIGLRQKDISHMETCTGNSIDSISKVCLYADACNIPYSLLFENEVNTGLSDFGYNKNDPIVIPSHHQNKGDDGMRKIKKDRDAIQINGMRLTKDCFYPTPYYLIGDKDDSLFEKNGDLRLSKNLSLNTVDHCGSNTLMLGTLHDSYQFVAQNLRTCDGNYIVTACDCFTEEKELLRQKGYDIVDVTFKGYDIVDVTFDEKSHYDFFKELHGRSSQEIVQDISIIRYFIGNNIPDYLFYHIEGYRGPIVELLCYMYLFSYDDVAQTLTFPQYVHQVLASPMTLTKEIDVIKKKKSAYDPELFNKFVTDCEIWENEFLTGSKFASAYSYVNLDELLLTMLADIDEGISTCFNIHISTDKSLREVCKQDKFAIFIDMPSIYQDRLLDIQYNIIFDILFDPLYQKGYEDHRNKTYPVLGKGIKFLFAEFGHLLAKCDNFDTQMAVCMSSHISMVICLQSVCQLMEQYDGGEAQVILGNIDTIVCSSIESAHDRGFIRHRCGIKDFNDFNILTDNTCLVQNRHGCIIDEKL